MKLWGPVALALVVSIPVTCFAQSCPDDIPTTYYNL
jgi:hypothetical protein